MSRGKFAPVRTLAAGMRFHNRVISVGRLAWIERRILFEFDREFPVGSLNPSPFKLRPAPGTSVIPGPERPFEGLHGVFNDSLSDGWGRLLMDRKLREVGIQPGALTPLDRLAWVGDCGMGALTYQPEHPALGPALDPEALDLDRLARDARLVLEDDAAVVIDQLLRLGGSPGGARPKALVGRSPDGKRLVHGEEDLPECYEHWLVKFGAIEDPPDMGAVEQAYAAMAREAGVVMPETALFPSKRGPGYFGMKRFDRGQAGARVHMLSLSGLLDADSRIPSVGYEELLKATRFLTRRQSEVEQVFTRMVFNVFAHNRDDHPRNHSFLMNGEGEWSVSPAYDVVFSLGPGGEHALAVGLDGKDPGEDHILVVANTVGISRNTVRACVERVRASVAKWPEWASEYGVSARSTANVMKHLRHVRGL